MASIIPDVATRGFANASSYDKHRPSFPPAAVDGLLEKLQMKGLKNARLLDLGAGTGKFTELLSKREEDFEIIAVEPHESMRDQLTKKTLRNVEIVAGDAVTTHVETQSVDAVIASQAFHWFANNEALEEIHRVLVPGGIFGMIWNIEDYNAPRSWQPRTIWEQSMKDIMWSFADNHPRFRHETWKEVFNNQLSTTPFTIQSADPLFSLPLGGDSVKFTYWLTRDAIWERFHSISYIAVLEEEALADVKRRVFEAMNGPDVETNEKQEVALHGQTVFYWTSAVPGTSLKNGG